jgi:para-aminobenzoate synthetase/4-amino-4-deoxychorismate lyase
VDAASTVSHPSSAALAEALRTPGTVLLDSSRPDEENDRALLFERPERILTAHRRAEVPEVLAAAEAATRTGRFVAGFVGYEAGYAFEPAHFSEGETHAADPLPLVGLGVYEKPQRIEAAGLEDALAEAGAPPRIQDLRFTLGRATYHERVAQVKDAIRAGEVYQINLTAPVRFRLAGGDALALYRRMRRRQPVPYGAWLNVGGEQHVLSASPELFFRRRGRRVWTRPMKGTAPRGNTPAEDERLRRALAADEKNRAENLMIVDLLRNDLSVCCEAGSVRAGRLFEVETYDTVSQMTSTVEGRLKPSAGLADLFRALFPCGSVTGAPKLRAMRHIRRLEDAPRGVYCGAVGFAGPEEAAFSVPIRTVALDGNDGRMGIGSGIVWDSDTEDEYEECLLKARFLGNGES